MTAGGAWRHGWPGGEGPPRRRLPDGPAAARPLPRPARRIAPARGLRRLRPASAPGRAQRDRLRLVGRGGGMVRHPPRRDVRLLRRGHVRVGGGGPRAAARHDAGRHGGTARQRAGRVHLDGGTVMPPALVRVGGDIPRDPAREVEWTPEATASGRRYMRYASPMTEVTRRLPRGTYGRLQSPDLWWPEDLAWVVATEIDAWSSYVTSSGTRTSSTACWRRRAARRSAPAWTIRSTASGRRVRRQGRDDPLEGRCGLRPSRPAIDGGQKLPVPLRARVGADTQAREQSGPERGAIRGRLG
jgi:hypothetical protein